MATYGSGLQADFWSKYYQRRAQKGGGLSASEMASLYEPMGAYDYQKSLAAEERARLQANQDRDFALRTQAQEDAAAAAKVSGVTSMVGTGANIYLGKRLLDIYGKGGAKVPEASATTGGFAGGETGLGPAFSEAPAVAPSVAASYSGAPIAEAAPGAANVGAAALPIAGEGAQASLATTSASSDASLAAYDASMAEGAAEGVGSTAGTTGGESALGTVSPYVSAAGYGYGAYKAADVILGTGEGKKANAQFADASRFFGGPNFSDKSYGRIGKNMAAGAAAGGSIAGPFGALVGGVIGGVIGVGAAAIQEKKIPGVSIAGREIIPDIDTVICSELHRQGLITDRQRRYGMMYGKQVGHDIYQGYLIAAEPVVKRMRRSRLYTKIVALLAIPAMHEMAHRLGMRDRGSLLGKAVLAVGIPLCRRAYRKSMEGSVEMEVA